MISQILPISREVYKIALSRFTNLAGFSNSGFSKWVLQWALHGILELGEMLEIIWPNEYIL